VPKSGWTSAIKLRAGDVLVLSNGEYVVVEAVQHEILESPVKVYNFEVEDFHTYFVGESSALVHNTCQRKQGDYHVFDTYELEPNKYYSSDSKQFKLANESFLNKIKSDSAFRKNLYKRHPELEAWVKNGNRESSPKGFTWHHSQQPGLLELVDRYDHRHNSRYYHVNGKGGRAIWGGGFLGRLGFLDELGNLLN